MSNIGLFGGAFDPPHREHVRTLEAACRTKELHEIWVLPSGCHRFKKPTDIIHRIFMCFKGFPKKIGKTKIDIQLYDITLAFRGSTYKLVNFLKQRYPQHKFFIIIGSDCAIEISKWDNYKKLIAENIFIVVDGPPYSWKTLHCWKKGTWIHIPNSTGFFRSSEFKRAISNIPKEVLRHIYENKLYLEEND